MWFEAAVIRSDCSVEASRPESNSKSGEICGSERGRLSDARTHHGHFKNVSLKLHEAIVIGRPAIDPQFLHRVAAIATICIQQISHLIADALQRSARQMARRRAAGQAEDRAAGVRIPVRRPQSPESRNKIYPSIVWHRLR